jgi:CBS domain containing-hemolysin-like protein
MVSLGLKRAKTLESAIDRLDRSIAATQLGVTLASIGLGWVGEPTLAQLLQPLFTFVPEAWSNVVVHTAATASAFILITFMHVVFGELIPKTLALEVPDRAALWLAAPLVTFARLTRPLTLVMSGTANVIVRALGYQPARGEQMVHTVDELLLLIEDTEEAGILPAEQAEFAQNVLRLSRKRVRDCLVPREKMAALELSAPPDKVLEAVRQGAHTRMPVYEGTLDNVVGIVNTKDLFYLFSIQGVVVLLDALYPPIFLDPGMTIAEALNVLRKAHRAMAVVRHEDKVLGLITLEDILEEIVGDIEDEHDRPTPKLVLRRPTGKPQPNAAKAKAGTPVRK